MSVGNCPVIGITCPSRPTKWMNWDLDAGVLLISAYSSHDKLIEAVEIEELRFFIDAQWHPERIKHTNLYLESIETARGSSL